MPFFVVVSFQLKCNESIINPLITYIIQPEESARPSLTLSLSDQYLVV